MLGSVTVNTGASGPGSFPNIEGVGLFIGQVGSGDGALNAIGVNTDLAALFTDGELVNTLEVARANGGPNWKAYAYGLAAGQVWSDVLDAALAGCQPELIVVCTPVTAAADLTAMQTEATTLFNGNRRVIFLASYAGIDPGTQTWADYLTAAQAVTTGVAGERVMVMPLLYGGELGAFAGKLAAFAFESKINRTPMRVRSGAVVNPGTAPVDSAGVALDLATLEALDTARFSVFQTYDGKEGVYCADANTLEAAGGDFPVAEWLRIVDKAARRVYLTAVGYIADDLVQNTPAGNASFATGLGAPLRTMAQAGEIKPLAKDAITVDWTSLTAVQIYMTVQPPNAPKAITVSITLDTSGA